ncbi:methyl-accepting chemotaxis protein [Halobacillus yeomjeoni]|uniref:Methyl-accepting chemotaxis protein n=1 Tax=Halobacillus yeomjeoni TaxID=311194 RepID=A0A931MUP1_9BACI|nr:methyl-accepting chemotaxis protein [Halobacillus yeomjeoni]MBH0230188.1 methyl-accepting chemotaxis protein [Halobacillus yeomjeoni]
MHSIKSRVRFILYLSMVGILVLIGFSTFFINKQAHLSEKSHTLQSAFTDSQEIQQLMTSTMQLQNQFFSQPNQDNAEGVKEAIQTVNKASSIYAEKYETHPEIADQFSNINDSTKNYINELGPLVNMYKLVGFSNDEGMYKFINQSYQEFNSLITTVGDSGLKSKLLELKINEQAFLNAPSEGNLNEFKQSADEFKTSVQSLALSTEESQALDRTLLKYGQTLTSMNNTYNQAENIRTSFEGIASNVTEQVNLVKTTSEDLLAQNTESQDNLKQGIFILLAILGVIILLTLYITGTLLTRSISKSIMTLKEGASTIGDGNLSHRIHTHSKDEMAELAEHFNDMAERMENSVKKVLRATGILNTSSEQLTKVSDQTTEQAEEVNEAINQVAIGSQDQAHKIEESHSFMSQVAEAIDNTKSAAMDIGKKLDEAEKVSHDGLNTVNRLEHTSSSFIQLATHMSSEVSMAAQQSQEVRKIVETIESIADNTDLLALNAAIESARAGDAGRGFAVVADEVRKLAERSKNEAQSIQMLVENMSSQMEQLNKEAEEFNVFKETQNDAVTQTKSSFHKITEHVKDINKEIVQVTEAVYNAEELNDEVKQRLQEISIISEQAVATAEEVAASSENQVLSIEQVNQSSMNLQALSQELSSEVSQFNIKESDEAETQIDEETSRYFENTERVS